MELKDKILRNRLKSNKYVSGITLISLVLTIIVLIILTGISINLLIGKDGIITKAKDSKNQMKIAQYIDDIELIRGEVTIDKEGKTTIDDLIEKIKDKNIIRGGKIEKIDEEKAEVITKEGYVIIITLKETIYDRFIKLEIVPELQEGDIVIRQAEWNTSTNKTSVTIQKGSNVSQTLEIQYQVNSDSENGWNLGTTVGDLKYGDIVNARLWNGIEGGTYISFKVEDSINPDIPSIEVQTGTQGINEYYTSSVVVKITEGTDGQSGVQKVTYSLSGATTQDETTITSGDTITISNNGTTRITAYTYDNANNRSEENSLDVKKDDTEPEIASIEFSGSATQTSLPITLKAKVTHSEEISGIEINSCRYVLNTSDESLGTDANSYTGGNFNSNEEEITIQPSLATDWYLHVLTIDGAGNPRETIKGPITVGENYHKHAGSSSSGGGCYTVKKTSPVYSNCTHIFGGAEKSGSSYKYYYYTDTRGGATLYECSLGNFWDNGGHGSPDGSNYTHQVQTGTRVTGYSTGCGKNENTLEGYSITY